MIFRPELVRLISQRKKTMTRRIADTDQCRYKIGRAYQVQPGRGKRGLFPITIQAIRREPLRNITLKDAKREGFVTTQEFVDYWTSLHGSFDPDVDVWVISFAVGDVIDRPMLLAARPGPPHGDYVHESFLAMNGEPEAVSQHDVTRFAAHARANDQDRAKHPDQQLRDGLMRELARWEDASGGVTDRDRAQTIRGIRRQIAALDRKLKAA